MAARVRLWLVRALAIAVFALPAAAQANIRLAFEGATAPPPRPLTVPAKPTTRSAPNASAPRTGAAKPSGTKPSPKKTAAPKRRSAKPAASSKAKKRATAKPTARAKQPAGKAATSRKAAAKPKRKSAPAAKKASPAAAPASSPQPAPSPAGALPAVHHYRPAIPDSAGIGMLDLGETVAHLSNGKGVMFLERGPTLTAAQGEWLAGMTAYRVTNWATYRQTNPTGPCGSDPVRWIGVRKTPSTDPSRAVPDSVDVALLSEVDIRAFRPDNPTLCLLSTFRDTQPSPVRSAAKAKSKTKAKAKARTKAKRKAAVKRGRARPK